MRKKICFVVSAPGTASSFLKTHMRSLREHFEVHLVANFPKEEEKDLFEGIVCHTVCVERPVKLVADIKAVCQLRRLFKKEQFYAVHSVTPKAGLVTALAGKLAGIENRIHIYTGQVWATRTGLMRWMLKSLDKLIALLNTKLLVDGQSQRRYLIENGVLKEENSSVIADGSISGVDVKRFAFSNNVRQEIRQELNLREDQIVFIFLGRLNRDKGIGELLEAFNTLVAENEKAYLLLVGTDEDGYDKQIEKYPNIQRGEHYCYYGPTPKPERLLHAGDVFVLPTYREGFGSSVIEASCLGLPVICSDTYGVMDAMVDDVTGLRCKVADVESLYNCMKKLYETPELRKELGRNGHNRVVEKFSGEVINKAWVDFYLNL